MKVMLLAAGRGERMRPLTDHTPKPLLPVGGKPIILWHVEQLVGAGITDIVINHAHLGHMIEAALGDGSQYGANIRYSPEVSALETAGGIANALPLLGDQPFAVINGDIFCDYDFAHLPLLAESLQENDAHLVLVDNPDHHPNGDFLLQGDRIVPPSAALNACSPLLTFSGIGLYRPELFAHITRGSVAALGPLLREQIAQGRVGGEHHHGWWVDVGTPQRLAEVDSRIRLSRNEI